MTKRSKSPIVLPVSIMMAVLIAALTLGPVAVAMADGVCPLTQGFWKKHPDAWPVTSLTIGGITYTQAQLLEILNTPIGAAKKADASLRLADQLIAAELNIANGSDPTPIAATIADADSLLSGCAIPCGVSPSSALGQQMTADAAVLAQYNSGFLTPNCGP